MQGGAPPGAAGALRRDIANRAGFQSRLATSNFVLVSYAAISQLLSAAVPQDPGLYTELFENVPVALFQWQLAAFGGVMIINVLNILFCTSQVQHNCNVLLIAIHIVAFYTDLNLVRRTTPVVRGAGGLYGVCGARGGGVGLFFPLRYVQWLHSTPTMLLLMALMSDLSTAQLGATIAADLVMILTGLVASWVGGPMQLIAGTVSFLAFVPVMLAMIVMMQDAIKEARGATAQFTLRLMLATTLAVWALFPLVWGLAHLGFLSAAAEHALWGVADYMAKVVFSSHLWQKNFVTIEQRKADAQEALDEANRALILERLKELLAVKGPAALTNELLHNSCQSAAGRSKMLAMIRSSAGCLLNIINATLDNAAVSTGTLKLGNYKVSLWRVSECVVRLTRPLLRENVALLNCVDRDFPAVQTDSTRLMQVLFNLLGNASRFTHAGSVRICASVEQDKALVSVVDTGVGITAERLPHIFKPFEQGAQAAGSTGLGLYLVKQCLDAMGCKINVSSAGTTLSFELPLADDDAESEESADVDALGAAIATASASARSSLESNGWGDGGGGARGRRGSLDIGRLAAALRRRLSSSQIPSSRRASLESEIHPPPEGRGGAAPFSSGGPSLAAESLGASTFSAGGGPTSTCSGGSAPANIGARLLGGGAGPGQQQHAALGAPWPPSDPGPLGGASSMGSDSAAAAAAGAAAPGAGGSGGSPSGAGGKGPSLAPPKVNHRTKHGSIQVLSVDDDAINQMVAATVLKSHKWGVIKCMSGPEALDFLSRCSVLPDLVLLDVMMPRMSGYDVARRIREMFASNTLPIIMMSASNTLPIIMVSAKAEEEDIVEGLKCGADDYVSKPFKRSELAARIRAHIRARDAFAEQQAADQQWMLQHNLLPRNVQRKLRAGETVVAEHHGAATVLWAEVVGLPRLAAEVPPLELVVMLNSLYTTWDELCEEEGALGVDFSGSTYVVVSGHDDNPQHLELILKVADGMLGVAAGTRYPDGSPVQIRLGVHCGAINTGLVGSKAVKFTLMGETVDVARQLAATGCPMAVHVSAAARESMLPSPTGALGCKVLPWTVQRFGFAGGRGGLAAGGAAGSSGALPPLAAPPPAGDSGCGGGGAGRAAGRPQQTYLLPSRYTPPAAISGAAAAAAAAAAALPIVSSAIETPDASDRAGPSAPGAHAAAAAAAAAAAGRPAAWAAPRSRRPSGAVQQEVPWLQLQDLPTDPGLSGPLSSAAAPPSASASDIGALASELALARTTQLEAHVSMLSRQADSAVGRERELQERLLALTAEHAKASTELSLAQQQLADARTAAASERRRADALQSQVDGGGAVKAQLGEVWRAMVGMKREVAALLQEGAPQQPQQQQQQPAAAGAPHGGAPPPHGRGGSPESPTSAGGGSRRASRGDGAAEGAAPRGALGGVLKRLSGNKGRSSGSGAAPAPANDAAAAASAAGGGAQPAAAGAAGVAPLQGAVGPANGAAH
ncbi:MAG: hypothetical protein J3K34DRAFT_495844 [Monoraphidium minutum]|nr:MAG: hypothetical protein J3K34DRAFT_495844 [Monoraphidium minutum]